jgi:peptidoglycan/xylan/chitin deacetylase (PgdA/CDA1 family)
MQISNIPTCRKSIFSDKVYAQSSDKENQSEKEVAITIDDLPFVAMQDYDLSSLKYYTSKLLNSLKEKDVPAIGFVIEKQLYKNDIPNSGIVSLLNMWLDAGMELGNHTYSHPDLHTISLEDYEQDFLQGNKITKMLMEKRGLKERYFRHPYHIQAEI